MVEMPCAVCGRYDGHDYAVHEFIRRKDEDEARRRERAAFGNRHQRRVLAKRARRERRSKPEVLEA
jgi:hypothetical protein